LQVLNYLNVNITWSLYILYSCFVQSSI
jgi:hypothetical protein